MEFLTRMIFRITSIPAAFAGVALAVPEGFTIHEFAGPPDADYPAAITVAPNGDVYVSSDRNGSLGKDEGMGRIIRCRDTDGDGRADDFVHFVPDVDSPRGGHMVGDTLYLVHPPYLSAFRDTDGDGVADEKRRLVEGLGGGIEHPRGADHTTNGVRMGIDGWLYVSVGDFGMADAVGSDGTRYTLHGGGVIRVRPDGSEMEPYALMARNICDTAISPALDLFSRDNTNDGKGWNTRLLHHTALADHGYPRLYQNFPGEAVAPLADYGGGAGTGALWLHEPGFPGDFGDMLYTCDWTTGNIYHHPATRDGASFAIGQKVFHKLPRATDLDVDGFSRLYLADWRGGKYRFAGEGVPVGMIHQVIPQGGGSATYEEVAEAGDARLVELLASRSGVQRLEAQREILKRGREPLFAEGVAAVAGDATKPPFARTAAIFTLSQLYGKDSVAILADLAADDAVREFALRAMTDRRGELDGVPADLYLEALADPDPRVVLQALIGLERLAPAGATPAILAASGGWREGTTSPRLRHTAIAAMISLGDVPALAKGARDPATRELSLHALRGIQRPEAIDALVALAAGEPDLRFGALAALARLHFTEKPWDLVSWWGTRPDDRGPYFEPVAWEGTASIRTALEEGYGALPEDRRGEFLDLLAANRIPVSELRLDGLDPVVAALGMSRPDASQIQLLAAAAKDFSRPVARRIECYRALGRGPEKLVTPSRLDVLAAWSREPDPPAEISGLIEDFVNDTRRGDEVRPLRQLAAKRDDDASRIAWKALLTVLHSPLAKDPAKKQVRAAIDGNPREVGFFLALADLGLPGFEEQIESALGFDNDELIAAAQLARDAVAGAAEDGKTVGEMDPGEVMAAAMTGRGDVALGKRLYTAQGCIACHAVDPAAQQKGPYLGSAGSKFTRDYLIESVLEPDAVVAQGFRTTLLTLADGGAALGFITAEADGVIEIRDIAGTAREIAATEITRRDELPQSMMPAGLAAALTIGEFTALIDYMVSLRAPEE